MGSVGGFIILGFPTVADLWVILPKIKKEVLQNWRNKSMYGNEFQVTKRQVAAGATIIGLIIFAVFF
ncbi:hypothetical protein, partial [Streptococcus suis]|uniref:hypothetical protein n=1 Tax=Streptococcus suis TaxID=1307 RepID=UPI001EE0D251